MFKWLEARRARKKQAEHARAQAARSNPYTRSDSSAGGVEDAVLYNNWGVPGQAGHITAPTQNDDSRHGDQGSRDHHSFKTGGGFGGETDFHTGGSFGGSSHDSGSSHSSSSHDSGSSSSSDSGSSSGGDGGGGGGGD